MRKRKSSLSKTAVRMQNNMTERLKNDIKNTAEIINSELEKICNGYEKDEIFVTEMKGVTDSARYSLTAGGKRIRPYLVRCFSRLCGGNDDNAITLGCALEMIHTYSLIHDDLPCMDNDDFRRGKPTNHKVFGEARAVLAGDALLTEAFGVIVKSKLSDKSKVDAVGVLSEKAGILGMIGGQEIDLSSECKEISLDVLRTLQRKKTGMLIEAACLLGCIAAECNNKDILESASIFAHSFGLAFQITDDILDVIGTSEELGKDIGSDAEENKCTFVTHLGLEGAKTEAKNQVNAAKKTITDAFGDSNAQLLCELCDYLLERRS